MSEKKSAKVEIQAPRGTRDFYPDDLAPINWIFDQWRAVSRRHGFEEFDGPTFEHLELYTVKSGQEIVSQLFSFQDRGERQLALRPEITPTLARMVAAKANALPRPVKWFSIPRAFRAERPQRGRLREFSQWNVDILGVDDVLADAECLFVLADLLRSLGLTAEHVELCVNSRTIVAALLEQMGVDRENHDRIYAVMDKYTKLDTEKLKAFALEQGVSAEHFERAMEILRVDSLETLATLVQSDAAKAELDRLHQLRDLLTAFGVGDYFRYKSDIVRGLAYYTGVVFEVFDRGATLRAVAGGGRYDNLIALFGGPAMPAVGFGMGDVVLMELLKDLKRVPEMTAHRRPEFFVIDADPAAFSKTVELVGVLRKAGLAAEMSYKRQGLGKQFKQADARKAYAAVILGQETIAEGRLSVKTLASGEQTSLAWSEFVADPKRFVGGGEL